MLVVVCVLRDVPYLLEVQIEWLIPRISVTSINSTVMVAHFANLTPDLVSPAKENSAQLLPFDLVNLLLKPVVNHWKRNKKLRHPPSDLNRLVTPPTHTHTHPNLV